jgi:hypothetical protein
MKPLCFVLMPFGQKPDPRRPGETIDFDRLYELAISRGIEDAGLEPIRADKEPTGGIIHKPMFERLVLCDYAVAELTAPNPNVFYELGIRHALRQNTTLPIFANHTQPPFDVALLRALPYTLGPKSEVTDELAAKLRAALTERLRTAREISRTAGAVDSPFHQLVASSQQSNLPADARLNRIRQTDGALFELLDRYGRHDKTDVFRDVVAYHDGRRKQLAEARALKPAEAIARLAAIQAELGPLEQTEAAIIIDLYLSYRAVSAWGEMRDLYARSRSTAWRASRRTPAACARTRSRPSTRSWPRPVRTRRPTVSSAASTRTAGKKPRAQGGRPRRPATFARASPPTSAASSPTPATRTRA